jgi:adenylate cyclase
VNLGDVVEEEGKILGDGVNIAARLESLAEAGGVCISGTAYDQVKNKVEVGYEYWGEHTVKNISEPVRVYRVLMEAAAGSLKHRRKRTDPRHRRRAQLVAVGVVMVAAAAVISHFLVHPSLPLVEKADLTKMAYPLPDKPSIAVLPFVNMSDDPKQAFFADGMAEEIINALSKLPQVFVIARNSSFTYKGKSVDVKQVGREMGVKYLLEGSVRRDGDRVRVTAQLVDAATGHHVFSERYDRELRDIFALQDEVTMKVLTALQVKLTVGEQARIWAKGTKNLDAYLKCLEARDKSYLFNKESNILARELAKEATELDPQYALAYSVLGSSHMMDVWLGASQPPQRSMAQAVELARKAITMDESLGEPHGLLGFLYTMTGEHDKGIEQATRAVALDPNSDKAHQYLGLALRFGGKPQEAIPVIKKAIRLNPFTPSNYIFNLGLALLFSGQHEEAIAECKKAAAQEPRNLGAQLALLAAYGFSGREEEARAGAAEVLRIDPNFSVERFSKTLVYKNPAERDRFIDALRKAGLK